MPVQDNRAAASAIPRIGVMPAVVRLLSAAGCAMLLASCAASPRASNPPPVAAPPRHGAPAQAPLGGSPAGNGVVTDGGSAGGPVIRLSYTADAPVSNPMPSFMYCIPLLFAAPVDRETSPGNEQRVTGVSYERKSAATSFYVSCEFEMRGAGHHRNTFDPEGMIASRAAKLKKSDPLSHVLAYIQCEGEGFGRIEVKGTIADGVEVVDEVTMRYNARGHRSPLTIGLYDVKPKDGQYRYENRTDELVVRVNALTFTRSDKPPRMGVSIASVRAPGEPEGLAAGVKGAMANMIVKPLPVLRRGNDALLQLGYAIYKQQPEFVFPKAANIRQDSTSTFSQTEH